MIRFSFFNLEIFNKKDLSNSKYCTQEMYLYIYCDEGQKTSMYRFTKYLSLNLCRRHNRGKIENVTNSVSCINLWTVSCFMCLTIYICFDAYSKRQNYQGGYTFVCVKLQKFTHKTPF